MGPAWPPGNVGPGLRLAGIPEDLVASARLGGLRRRIRPLVKRQTKEQVAAELPDKQEQVLEVDLHPRHRRLYQTRLKVGGSGLNLTEADYCFLLDPWWNPATEAQAIDRTHRIGQTRNVMVYRLIARDTIEQKVMALQARKAELFASVIDEGNVFGRGLDEDDIRGLLA
jgi:SNF2 family DNA or RNA helicase